MATLAARREKWLAGQERAANHRPSFTIERWFEVPRKWTFQMPKVRKWIEARLTGDVLNLFGGVTRLTYDGAILYNDLNVDLPADFRRDAYDLSQWADSANRFDTVIFDPPYTAFQAVRTYGSKKAQEVSHARDVVELVLKPGGRVISLGFNSTGMSESRGFVKTAIALVNCGASHNDMIMVAEDRLVIDEQTAGQTVEAQGQE